MGHDGNAGWLGARIVTSTTNHNIWVRFAAVVVLCTLADVLFRVFIPSQQVRREWNSASHRPTAGETSKIEVALTTVLEILNHAENATGLTVPCRNDSTLPKALPEGNMYLIAMNLYNNEDVMPHNLASFIRLLMQTDVSNVFVSVFESGSTDSTPRWLVIFAKLLHLLEVPHRIRAGQPQERSYESWEGGRIHFLSEMRNEALSPLWPTDTDDYETWQQYFLSDTLAEDDTWPADDVIFLNDVYLCEYDIIRLAHGQGDVVCGMDFDHPKVKNIKLNSTSSDLLANVEGYLDGLLYHELRGYISGFKSPWRRHTYDPVPQDYGTDKCGFYDIWVARDVTGAMIKKWPPYVTDLYSQSLVTQGLPFPVKCCWNGLVRIPAAPFQNGLRFRSHTDRECAASECTLLCHDLWRLGYANFVADPGIRVAYNPVLANVLYTGCVDGIRETGWAEVQKHRIDRKKYNISTTTTCCELKQNQHGVQFDKQCFPYDPFKKNFTQVAFETEFKAFYHSAFLQRRRHLSFKTGMQQG